MIRIGIVFFSLYVFTHGVLYCNQVKGWNILSDNLRMAEKAIYAAKKYNVNHLQLSHHMIHNLNEISDTSKLNKINHLTELAHNEGIAKVYIWDHALYEKQYYPQKFFKNNSDQLDLDNEELWDWIKKDYERHLKKIKNIDGVVLTFIETGLRIENQYSELYRTPSQKFKKLIRELNEVFFDGFGLDIVLRTFSYNAKEIDNIIEVVNSIDSKNLFIMIKESNHDFFVTHPPNNLINDISNKKRIIIEFDAAHEFSGQGVVASIFPKFHYQKAQYFSKYKNVVGYSVRIDRYGDTSIIDNPTEINLFAIEKGFSNIKSTAENVIKSFISNKHGDNLVQELYKVYSAAEDIILSSFYTLGLNTERHSKLNYHYRSIYTRHVSGRWLENPVTFIEHGVNKEYHYWQDIVNHLSPKQHKSGNGYYKPRSSPKDSISYRALNLLEIPYVIENEWLDTLERMNELYLSDILKEKQWSVKQSEEILKLIIAVKPKMDDGSYQKLKSIYHRTLLAARLRSAISAVYYGSRIESKSPNLQKLINKNKAEAERIIKEIENYASRYPIGEYDWKKDAELAKIYIDEN